jgi:hypothetical protein
VSTRRTQPGPEHIRVYETEPLLETKKSMPDCQIAEPQVSPSMPTHAVAAYVPPPEPLGLVGFGIVNVPVTDLNEPCARAISLTDAAAHARRRKRTAGYES